ncbi:hypothetical protein SAMN02982929_05340 [Saccharopolyspora kobensis]|uniref:Uncharacterized protein n=1 Tax=Saccharopolyspora kobensis TaxID=146035 RepID=A0A1H6E009_9PSEU|nr:hypothetical protein [Saccharopolyspora kobensis]SEG90912.1 hypothetical protein SAMN02982929_05340 [Saccharopolyspora kobensis]SFD94637.1 hypothetical protein SAMN05216506_107316 [Saccharopolyspora kobensis]
MSLYINTAKVRALLGEFNRQHNEMQQLIDQVIVDVNGLGAASSGEWKNAWLAAQDKVTTGKDQMKDAFGKATMILQDMSDGQIDIDYKNAAGF